MRKAERIVLATRVLTAVLAMAVIACGGSSSDDAAGGQGFATPDLGPMAPAADGKPVNFGLDGVELGMTAEEVKAIWGEPLSDKYGQREYKDRGGYETVRLTGDPTYMMTLASPKRLYQDEAMPELTNQFGPPIGDPEELALLHVGERKTLFRAARYAYAVAEWAPDFDADEKPYLSELTIAMHPRALSRMPRSELASLEFPFPMTLPDPLKSKVRELRDKSSEDVTTEVVGKLLGRPVWQHPASLEREAWEYWYWASDTRLTFFFTDGVLNGYETQGLK
jgi:hypothetical protein